MKAFLESPIGQLVARTGILGLVLAWALWSNDKLVERLFVIIENNTRALIEVQKACGDRYNGNGRNEN
jgi:hypothetical protein